MNYNAYKDMCKQHNITNPYKDEFAYNTAYGIKETRISLELKPKHVSKLDDIKPKKVKVVKSYQPKPKVVKVPKERKGVDRSKMTPEELRLHKNALSKKSKDKQKEKNPSYYSRLNDEERTEYNRQKREYYHANKAAILASNKKYRQTMTPEQKAKHAETQKAWTESNRADRNRNMREYRARKKARKLEAIESTIQALKELNNEIHI